MTNIILGQKPLIFVKKNVRLTDGTFPDLTCSLCGNFSSYYVKMESKYICKDCLTYCIEMIDGNIKNDILKIEEPISIIYPNKYTLIEQIGRVIK
jgi:hypothetical protein